LNLKLLVCVDGAFKERFQFKQQEKINSLSDIFSLSMEGLIPEKKAEQEIANLTVLLALMLEPHKTEKQKEFIGILCAYHRITFAQTEVLFNYLGLKEV
jgi:hypothetical protein